MENKLNNIVAAMILLCLVTLVLIYAKSTELRTQIEANKEAIKVLVEHDSIMLDFMERHAKLTLKLAEKIEHEHN